MSSKYRYARVLVADEIKPAWDHHVTDWENCLRCPLHLTRHTVVLCRGNLPCNVLFIGEAPGESEDVMHYPFVGLAGEALDMIISRAQQLLDFSYAVTNVVGCIPRVPVEIGYGAVRPPVDSEAAACAPRVQQLMEMANPYLIVTLGITAQHYFSTDALPSKNILQMVHPAWLLRQNSATRTLAESNAVSKLIDAIRNAR